jgi:hypothetical protein
VSQTGADCHCCQLATCVGVCPAGKPMKGPLGKPACAVNEVPRGWNAVELIAPTRNQVSQLVMLNLTWVLLTYEG